MADLPYEVWRSKTKGYLVTVTNVFHQPGRRTNITYVTFTNDKKSFTWSAPAFLKQFEPVGRKLRRPTVWQRLLGKDPF